MPPSTSASLLQHFIFERVLNDDPVHHRLVLLGTLPTGPVETSDPSNEGLTHANYVHAPAIISLQKTHFGESHQDLISSINKIHLIEQNDVYSEALAWRGISLPGESDYKLSVIVNATLEHIAKRLRQKPSLIRETPDIYKRITLPWIESIPPERIQWVYNILSHEREADKILFEDPSPTNGYLILPDFKWDLVSVSSLYLLALVHSKDLRSIRDLRKSHVGMLKSIRREAARVSKAQWGVGLDSLKMFFHYQPGYYHLHVHVISTDMEGYDRMNVAHAHLLDDVISLLETESDGVFERMTLTYTVTDLHPISTAWKQSQESLDL